jgi:hypothetical protein
VVISTLTYKFGKQAQRELADELVCPVRERRELQLSPINVLVRRQRDALRELERYEREPVAFHAGGLVRELI